MNEYYLEKRVEIRGGEPDEEVWIRWTSRLYSTETEARNDALDYMRHSPVHCEVRIVHRITEHRIIPVYEN